MSDRMFIGIDPGMSGGLCCLDGERIIISAMPDTEKDIYLWFEEIKWSKDPTTKVFAVIEKVHSMPKQGVSSTFKFGYIYGFLRCCLIASAIPFDDVTPQCWQKYLGIPPRARTEGKSQHKTKLKQKAQQLFPDLRVTLKTCDALLLAEYCKRIKG